MAVPALKLPSLGKPRPVIAVPPPPILPLPRHPPQVVVPPVVLPLLPTVRTPAARTPQVVAPQVVAPQVVAPQVVAPQVVAPQVVAPQVVAPQVVLPHLRNVPHTPKENVEVDPWIPERVEGAAALRITSLTPVGTIVPVPTSSVRPPTTPRRLPNTPGRTLTLRVIDQRTGDVKVDPLLTAAIYLDCTRPDEMEYNRVSERMKAITETINLQHQYSTTLKPLMKVSGKVSVAVFEQALAVYENNQVYYQDRIDDKTLPPDEISTRLTELEHWFMSIIEPPNYDEGRDQREATKATTGRSGYCDPELYSWISPIHS